MERLKWSYFWVITRFKSLIFVKHLSRTRKETQGEGSTVLSGQLSLACGRTSHRLRKSHPGWHVEGAQGHSVWGKLAGKKYPPEKLPDQVALRKGEISACGDGADFLGWREEHEERHREEEVQSNVGTTEWWMGPRQRTTFSEGALLRKDSRHGDVQFKSPQVSWVGDPSLQLAKNHILP